MVAQDQSDPNTLVLAPLRRGELDKCEWAPVFFFAESPGAPASFLYSYSDKTPSVIPLPEHVFAQYSEKLFSPIGSNVIQIPDGGNIWLAIFQNLNKKSTPFKHRFITVPSLSNEYSFSICFLNYVVSIFLNSAIILIIKYWKVKNYVCSKKIH